MSEAGKDYVVYGMRARCSEGTMDNYISTDTGHGVVYQGCPLLNANDHTVQVNLTHFGDCNSKKIYEDAKKQVDEKFASEAGEGFFTKAAKWAVKTVIKANISVKEYLFFHKCELDTPLPWIYVNEEHMIDGAPALTIDSQCACRYGGIITIVPPETETEEVEVTTGEGTMESAMAENVQEAAVVMLSEESGEQGMESILQVGKVGAFLAEYARLTMSDRSPMNPEEYLYIWKYVQEDTLGAINPRWTENMNTFKQIYGDDVFLQMRILMWQYNITDETSILMFLSTMGNETGYGTSVIEEQKSGDNYEEFEDWIKKEECRSDNQPPQLKNGIGIGLLQVSFSATQSDFIRYKHDSLNDGDPMKEIMENYFGESKFTNSKERSEPLDNAAGFIYTYYPMEASMWYWGTLKEKVAIFDDSVPLGQINYTINDYIVYYKENNANMDNVFLAIQYALNGTQDLKKTNLQDICDEPEFILQGNQTTVSIKGNTAKDFPKGWDERKADWDAAKGLMQNEGE